MAELASYLWIVPHMRSFYVPPKYSAPLTRGFFLCRSCPGFGQRLDCLASESKRKPRAHPGLLVANQRRKPEGASPWLHEIKHDGFRIIARKNGAQVRLYSRPGNDLTRRFPLIVETLARLRSRSCIIDGEAVAGDDNGVASFDLVRHHRANERIFLYAFDLIELNGDDLRRDPLEVRKATLASIVAKARPGIRFNEHIEGDGPTVFAHACKMGLEGIVSKRKDDFPRDPDEIFRNVRSANGGNGRYWLHGDGVRRSARRCKADIERISPEDRF